MVKNDKVKKQRAKAKASAAKTIADADSATMPNPPKLLAIKDKPAASSEGTKGATKRNKGKQADIKIEDFKELNKQDMIIVIQDEIPNPKKPASLNKLTEQQIAACVAKRLGENDKPAKKQRRNKGPQSSLVTA